DGVTQSLSSLVTMRNTIKLLTISLIVAGVALAQNIVGDWQGTLKAGPAELRLVLHISETATGALKATLDSVDQGANGIAVTSISLRASTLTFSVDEIQGSYEGKVRSTLEQAPCALCSTSSTPKTGSPPPWIVPTRE